MRTTSHISAVALGAALLMTPNVSMAQLLDGGGEADVSVDAGVDVGGDSGGSVDVGGDSGGSVDADVSLGSDSGSDDSLVDLDVNSGGDADPSDGSLTVDGDLLGTDAVDATVTSGTDQSTEVDVEVLGGGTAEPSGGLITGDVRISALDETARAEALISLVNDPNLAGIDLDAAIDDTQVAIVAAADLLSEDALADVRAAIEIGGAGRAELLAALSSSSELTAILEVEGVELADVLAVQIGEDGATEVIVLGGAVQLQTGQASSNEGGIDGNGEEPSGGLITGDTSISALDQTVRADALISLINDPNLADVDLDAAIDDTSVAIIAAADLLGPDALADVQAAIEIGGAGRAELLAALSSSSELTAILEVEGVEPADVLAVQIGEDGATEVIVRGAAQLQIGQASSGEGGTDGAGSDGDTGDTGAGTDDGGAGAGTDDGNASAGTEDGDAGNDDAAAAPSAGNEGIPPTSDETAFRISEVSCSVGTSALASGADAPAAAVANADNLELVLVSGCNQPIEADNVERIQAAVEANPEITLENTNLTVDDIIGATIEGDTVTLYLYPADS